jgi:hypothetical protein
VNQFCLISILNLSLFSINPLYLLSLSIPFSIVVYINLPFLLYSHGVGSKEKIRKYIPSIPRPPALYIPRAEITPPLLLNVAHN